MSLLRYVILEHRWRGIHYDLMFEHEGKLRTWKCPAPPSAEPQSAALIFEHRLAYLDYEGAVSGGRGEVTRWDAGLFEGDPTGEPPIRLLLAGRKCNGILELRQIEGARWQVSFQSKEWATGSAQ